MEDINVLDRSTKYSKSKLKLRIYSIMFPIIWILLLAVAFGLSFILDSGIIPVLIIFLVQPIILAILAGLLAKIKNRHAFTWIVFCLTILLYNYLSSIFFASIFYFPQIIIFLITSQIGLILLSIFPALPYKNQNKSFENIVATASRASKTKRALNSIIDSAILSTIILTVFYVIIKGYLFKIQYMSSSMEEILLIFLPLLIFLLYFVLSEAIFGKTLGKLITHTSVCTFNEEKPTFEMIWVRTISRLIPFEPLIFLFINLCLHDSLSKTQVISDNQLNEHSI